MSAKSEFMDAAKDGRVLVRACSQCRIDHPATARFCTKCGSADMTNRTMPGLGKIATYTIITVPPAGFEEYTPYAFVVMSVDGTDLRVSGFMGGIATPDQLPVGARARVAGYDERGLLIEKA